MEKNVRKGSSIGQFDLIKGIGIFCIIMRHALGLFDANQLFSATAVGVALGVLVKLFNNMIMPAFFIISGYGFRRESVKTSICKQAKYLMLPYLFVMIITSVLNLIIHYATFHYLPGAVEETKKVFGGFLIGAADNLTIGNTTFFANGASWFLLALFLSWNLLNIIYHFFNEKTGIVVLGVVLVGWILGTVYPACVWGIPQAMVGTGYLYIGYRMKKKHWLLEQIPIWQYIIGIFFSLLTILFGNVIMASNVYKLGLLDIIANAAYAMLFIRLILHLNQVQSKFLNAVSYIGRLSLWIICIHTVEFIAIPWYLLVGFTNSELWNLVIVLAGKCIIITIGVWILRSIIKVKIRRKQAAR